MFKFDLSINYFIILVMVVIQKKKTDIDDVHLLRNNVATNIKVAMAMTNVYQKDLAQVLGITQPTLSSKLAGKTTWTLDDIEKVSSFFHVKPETLLVAGHGFEPWTSGSIV